MRYPLTLALLLFAEPLAAQGYIGGYALDSATSAPMPCVQVTLVDTAGHIVARQMTTADGMFQLDAPPKGTYRLRFFIWRHEPMIGPAEDLEPTMEKARKYSLNFRADPAPTFPIADTAADAPPVPIMNSATLPRFPRALFSTSVREVSATFEVVVDSTGRTVPSTVKVTSSTHSTYTKEVERFLRGAKFKPARRDRLPVCALIRNEKLVTRVGPMRS